MIGQAISHYPELCRCTASRKAERDAEQRDKVFAKLGEGVMSSLNKKLQKIDPVAGPSFVEKYNNLVPPGGRRCV